MNPMFRKSKIALVLGIVLGIAAGGCYVSNNKATATSMSENGLLADMGGTRVHRMVDVRYGVVCYVTSSATTSRMGSVACLPLSQTRRPFQR